MVAGNLPSERPRAGDALAGAAGFEANEIQIDTTREQGLRYKSNVINDQTSRF